MFSENAIQLSDADVEGALRDVVQLYGYDFTNYSRASIKRRISRLLSIDKFASFAEFHFRLRNDAHYFTRFLEQVTVNVTEMFRDATFYSVLRDDVLPMLATLPRIRIWHAGCSTGEEVYSMAILLHEANLLDKSFLFATDINPAVLEQVRLGIVPAGKMGHYARNYVLSGGRQDFSSYFTVKHNRAKLNEALSRNTLVDTYDLVTERALEEFHLIMCRNVLIYFDKPLQDRILMHFHNSLEPQGFLALGSHETLRFTDMEERFSQVGNKEKIWRRRR